MPPKKIRFAPVVCPLELASEHLERYLEIRMLCLVIHPSGERAVSFRDGKEAGPGHWNPQPGDYPPMRKIFIG